MPITIVVSTVEAAYHLILEACNTHSTVKPMFWRGAPQSLRSSFRLEVDLKSRDLRTWSSRCSDRYIVSIAYNLFVGRNSVRALTEAATLLRFFGEVARDASVWNMCPVVIRFKAPLTRFWPAVVSHDRGHQDTKLDEKRKAEWAEATRGNKYRGGAHNS